MSSDGFAPEALDQLLKSARRMAELWCGPADADDIAQEAALRALAQVDPPRNIVTWLYVVTRRLQRRQEMQRRTRSRAEAVYLRRDPVMLPSDLLLDLDTLLSRLGERDRRLLHRVAEGALSSELAAEFGCPVRNVGQMVARARRKARRERMGRR